jgi:hypothetical protein
MSRAPSRNTRARTTPRPHKGSRSPHREYRSTGLVSRYELRHPGVRTFVENLLRRRLNQSEISAEIEKRFGVKISRAAISRFYTADVRPAEEAEAAAYRQAHAQARALIEEMKADPTLDAAQIAELMLANQIVKDRTKLGEADIMDLYKEQRERRKLELQSKALRLREKQAKAVLEKLKPSRRQPPVSNVEMVGKIREIYGLTSPPQPVNASGCVRVGAHVMRGIAGTC